MLNGREKVAQTPVSAQYYLRNDVNKIPRLLLQQDTSKATKTSLAGHTAFDKIDVIRASDRVSKLVINLECTRELVSATKFHYTPGPAIGGFQESWTGNGGNMVFAEEATPIEWESKVRKTKNVATIHFINMKPLAPGEVQRFRIGLGQDDTEGPATVLGIHEVDAKGQAFSQREAYQLHNLHMRVGHLACAVGKFNEKTSVIINGNQPQPPRPPTNSWFCGLI